MSGYDDSHPETHLDKMAIDVIENNTSVNGFNNAHYEYYMELLVRTKFLPIGSFIKERFWHLYHKTDIKPTCAHPTCDNKVNWHRDSDKHSESCSARCKNLLFYKRKSENLEKTSNLEDGVSH